MSRSTPRRSTASLSVSLAVAVTASLGGAQVASAQDSSSGAAACITKSEWRRIESGMSQAAVKRILGRPVYVNRPFQNMPATWIAWSDCGEWQPRGYPTVYFALSGKVTRKGVQRSLPGVNAGGS